MARRAVGAMDWWCARRAHRRDGIHRLESVGGQREGLHRIAALLRRGQLADGAVVRRARWTARGQAPCARRVPPRTRLLEPSRWISRWAGGGDRRARATLDDAAPLATVVRRRRCSGRVLCAGPAALAIGLTPCAQEPIRAAHFPAINEGEPTSCTEGFRIDCTLSAETWTRLRANIDRVQYGGHSVLAGQASFPAQMQMWWLYFRWQWLRDAHGSQPTLQALLALAFLAL